MALNDAIIAANWTDVLEDREVYIPAGHTFHMMPVKLENLYNITLTVDGTVYASKRFHSWPTTVNLDKMKYKLWNVWEFSNVHGFKLQGSGTIDGNGYMWWMREYLGTNPYGDRPSLFRINTSTDIEITGVKFRNSPLLHVHIKDYDGGYFHDFEIEVDARGQLELNRLFTGASLLPWD